MGILLWVSLLQAQHSRIRHQNQESTRIERSSGIPEARVKGSLPTLGHLSPGTDLIPNHTNTHISRMGRDIFSSV